jgi:hypothetical protein
MGPSASTASHGLSNADISNIFKSHGPGAATLAKAVNNDVASNSIGSMYLPTVSYDQKNAALLITDPYKELHISSLTDSTAGDPEGHDSWRINYSRNGETIIGKFVKVIGPTLVTLPPRAEPSYAALGHLKLPAPQSNHLAKILPQDPETNA